MNENVSVETSASRTRTQKDGKGERIMNFYFVRIVRAIAFGAAFTAALLGSAQAQQPITLTAPTNGTIYSPPASFTVSAQVTSDPNLVIGGPYSLTFYRNGTAVYTPTGVVFGGTYSFTESGLGVGSYTYYAKLTTREVSDTVIYTQYNSNSSTVTVNAAPTVSVASPANGGVFATAPVTATLTANASDTDGTVSRVDYYTGSGSLIGTATSAPYTVNWGPLSAATYTVYARATDNGGAATNSTTISFRVNAAPTGVAVMAPPTNTVIAAGSTVTLSASAADSDGSISKVEFFRDATLVGTVTSAPYNFNWTNVPSGAYYVTARATDNDGATATSAAIYLVSNSAPTVALSAPANGTVFPRAPASIALSATASDADGSLTKVEFYSGSTLLGTVTSAPYTYTWANVAAGTYSLTARAYDNRNVATTSAAASVRVNAAPTVSMTSPANNALASTFGSVTLKASASDTDGTISRVSFYQAGTTPVLLGTSTSAPFSFVWSNPPVGVQSVYARAMDNNDSTTDSSPISINVVNAPLATVALLAPANAGIYNTGISVPLAATAVISGGPTITKVEFFQGSTLIGAGTLTSGIYKLTWSSPAAGTYSVIARSTDSNGYVVDSTPASVSVVGPSVISPPNLAGSLAGSAEGSLGVSPSGMATYSMPIAIPPGTAGIQPSVSLSYTSTTAVGPLGAGWSIGGLSVITRCGKTVVNDGTRAPVALTSADPFCLDGQRLILVSGSHGTNAEYRTEIDSFARIRSFGTNASDGPNYWLVETKDGRQLYFGGTPTGLAEDARIQAQGRTVVLTWALSWVQDRRGNYYTVSYVEDSVNGEYYPKQISYTGNSSAALAPYNAVRFNFAARPDVNVRYVAGSKLTNSVRLTSISTFVNVASDGTGGTAVRNFNIAYSTSAASGRSLVTSVTDCDGAAPTSCLPATQFNWSTRSTADNTFAAAGSGVWGGPLVVFESSTINPPYNPGTHQQQLRSQVIVGDFNGDGRADLARTVGEVATNAWQICLSTGTSLSCQTWTTSFATLSRKVIAGDFNGDGKTDLAFPPNVASASAAWDICYSTGAGFNCTQSTAAAQYQIPNYYVVGDFNADGRDDVLVLDFLNVKGWLCPMTASGFGTCTPDSGDATFIFEPGGDGPRIYRMFADVNGDGRPDLVTFPGSGSGNGAWSAYLASDSGFSQTRVLSSSSALRKGAAGPPVGGATRFGDVNGDPFDSYPDILASDLGQTPPTVELCRSTGTGLACQTITSGLPSTDYVAGNFADLDGDGRPDGLVPGTTNSRVCQVGTGTSFTYSCADWTGLFKGDLIADFNGDGIPDTATYNESTQQWTVNLTGGNRADVLTRVSDGFGRYTDLSYKRINDATVYTPGSGAVYPQRDVQDSRWVVSQVRNDNGVGSTINTDYKYGGLRAHLTGRGDLGFAWMEVTDGATQVRTHTDYAQDFPYTGIVKSSKATHVPTSVDLKVVTNTLANITTASANVYFPFVSNSVETTSDLNAAPISTVTTATPRADQSATAAYDVYGNQLSSSVTTVAGGETFVSYTTSTYDNIVASWLIGLLRTSANTRTSPGFTTGSTFSVARNVSMSYDAYGQLTQQIVQPGVSQYELKTDYGRDPQFGVVTTRTLNWLDPVTATNKTLPVETLTYDSRKRWPLTVKNAKNHTETRAYADGHGGLTSLTGPNNLTTTWTYDAWGRKTKETRADTTSTAWDYRSCIDSCGGAVAATVTRQLQGATAFAVPSEALTDRLGRVVLTRTWGFDGTEIRKAQTYNGLGQLATTTRPYFIGGTVATAQYEYDPVGRRKKLTLPLSASTSAITQWAYNGLALTITNANNNSRTETRNGLGKLRQVVDEMGYTTAYLYDPFGNLVRTTDAKGNKIVVTYDTLGRKTQLADPDLGTWNYLVDPLGQTWRQTDAKNQVTTFTFDELGRVTRRLAPDQDANWEFDTQTKGIGKLGEAYTAIAGGGRDYRRIYAYDSLGREASITTRLDQDYVQAMVYDSYGRLRSTSHTRNSIGGSGGPAVVVDQAYNPRGYLAQIRTTAANEEQVRWSVLVQDAEQRVRSEALGNGLLTQRNFSDWSGRLGAIAGGPDNGSGAIGSNSVQNDTYVYDALGNLATRVQLGNSGALVTENFSTYDALNRLKSSQVVGQSAKTYNYDELGNLTLRSGVGSYAYPPSGTGSVRPHAVSSITGTVLGVTNPSFTYDANGNFSSGGGRTATWTSFNAPATVSKGATTTTFAYGPEGQRAKQTLSTGTTIYYGGAIEKEVGGSTVIKTYLPRALGYVEESGTTARARSFHKDHLGSVIALTDGTGVVLERLSYDPWGKRRNLDGTDAPDTLVEVTDRTGFTGQEAMDPVNLVHMNGRLYDPITARMLSADPTVPEMTNPQALNRYAYVLNNPLGYSDPSGYKPMYLVGNQGPEPLMQWETGLFGDKDKPKDPEPPKCDNDCQKKIRELEKLLKACLFRACFFPNGLPAINSVIATLLGGEAASGRSPPSGSGATWTPAPCGAPTKQCAAAWQAAKTPEERQWEEKKERELAALRRGNAEPLAVLEGLLFLPIRFEAAAGVAARELTATVPEGTTLFRVFGGEAQGLGRSWTTVDPGKIANYREAAGLYPANTGQFLIEGRLINTERVFLRDALPGPGNIGGGLPEVVVPNPARQICIVCVSGVNPPF